MNKAELVSAIAEKAGIDKKKDVDKVVKAFVDVVTETLVKGDKISLIGFGTFEVRKTSARTGKNPRTGAEVKIPAKNAPKFKAGKALKDAVNA